MKIFSYFIIVPIMLISASLCAQEAQPASAENAQNGQQAAPAQAETRPAQAPGPRRMRVIENREFSNEDKIKLLLSAHCDFPSKEDLISSINEEMFLKTKKQTAGESDQTAPVNTAAAPTPAAPSSNKSKKSGKSGKSTQTSLVDRVEIENYLQDILFSILNDPNELFSVRRRALEALAYFDTPKNIKMLEYIVTHPEQIKKPLMLVQAIRAYPQVAPSQAAKALERYLDSPNDMIRFVTISTLKNTPGQDALNILKKRRQIETNRFFQSRLDEAITNHCKKPNYCTDMR